MSLQWVRLPPSQRRWKCKPYRMSLRKSESAESKLRKRSNLLKLLKKSEAD
jgi:hypothetical protein